MKKKVECKIEIKNFLYTHPCAAEIKNLKLRKFTFSLEKITIIQKMENLLVEPQTKWFDHKVSI